MLACQVILEPINYNGGATLPQPGYLEALKEQCKAAGVLIAIGGRVIIASLYIPLVILHTKQQSLGQRENDVSTLPHD
jgi:hypothetical protein